MPVWEHASMAQVNAGQRATETGIPRSRLERSRDDRVVGGVAGGIGRHVGVNSNIVRAVFIGSSFALGFGLIVYLLTWLLAPLEAATADVEAPPARRIRMPTGSQALGIGLVAAGLVVLLWISGLLVRRRARLAGGAGRDRLRDPVGSQRRRGAAALDARRASAPRWGRSSAGRSRCLASPSAASSSWPAWASSSPRTPRWPRPATCCWR